MSTPAELLQIHLLALTQIVTQVCAEAGGRNAQSAAKSRTFHWLNGRIRRKNAQYHEPMAAGSHEVSGSIPLISTKRSRPEINTHANAESIKAAGDIFRNALKAKKDDSKQA